jgi:hypothetical protein
MRVRASCPAGGAVRAGWPESCRSSHARSGRGRRLALTPGGHPLPISNSAAAGVAAVAEVAEAAIGLAPVGSRSRARARPALSAAHLAGRAGTPHSDPPPQGGREMCDAGRPEERETCLVEPPHSDHPDLRRDPPPKGARGMCDGGGGAVGVEDVAHDRTVHRLVAARRGRRQADRPGRPNSAE